MINIKLVERTYRLKARQVFRREKFFCLIKSYSWRKQASLQKHNLFFRPEKKTSG